MRARRRAVSGLAVLAIICWSACQSATPPGPVASQAPTLAPLAPTPQATAAPLEVPTTIPSVRPIAPPPVPTAQPTLPTSVLETLPPEQQATVRQARAALAGGDYA